MKELGREVFENISGKHPELDLVNRVTRIYRDARRLFGRGPYKESLWFSVEAPSEDWSGAPTFWFEIGPEKWSYGLGYYNAGAKTMAKFRARMNNDGKRFEKLIAPLKKQDVFVLEGDEYSRKRTSPFPVLAEWYNRKTFSLMHEEKNSELLYSPELVGRITTGFEFLMPLYIYFSTLAGDPEPREM